MLQYDTLTYISAYIKYFASIQNEWQKHIICKIYTSFKNEENIIKYWQELILDMNYFFFDFVFFILLKITKKWKVEQE